MIIDVPASSFNAANSEVSGLVLCKVLGCARIFFCRKLLDSYLKDRGVAFCASHMGMWLAAWVFISSAWPSGATQTGASLFGQPKSFLWGISLRWLVNYLQPVPGPPAQHQRGSLLVQGQDQPIMCLAAHPTLPRVAIAGYSGVWHLKPEGIHLRTATQHLLPSPAAGRFP